MEHEHNITGKKVIFLIDPETRQIKTSDGSVPVIAQYDHNSTKIVFEMPRHIDGHDMAACSAVQIHYINIQTNQRKNTPGVYEAQELAVKTDNDDVVTFSWKISGNATHYAGVLCFSVRFYCSTDGDIDYSWSSEIFDHIRVAETYDNSNAVALEYADILEQWRDMFINGTGAAGGYYSPEVSQLDSETMLVKFLPSSKDMQPVPDCEVKLPKGAPGEPGKTPAKGTDYWTSDDKQEIVSDVLAALPIWAGGSY